jgi:hypothetical protein
LHSRQLLCTGSKKFPLQIENCTSGSLKKLAQLEPKKNGKGYSVA